MTNWDIEYHTKRLSEELHLEEAEKLRRVRPLGGTPLLGSSPCDTCVHFNTIKGQGSQEVRLCKAVGKVLDFVVTECSLHASKSFFSLPDLLTRARIMQVKRRRPAGMVGSGKEVVEITWRDPEKPW